MMIVGGVKFSHLFVLTIAYMALGGLFVAYLMWSDSRSSEIPADAEQKIELVSADGTADKSPSRIDHGWHARSVTKINRHPNGKSLP